MNDMSSLENGADVVVVGGGVAGLTLALQLRKARPETSIVVVERQHHPVPEATHKVGESTVEIAGYYLREVLGLGKHLTEEQLPKFGLRMFFSNGDNSDITQRVELGHSVRPAAAVGTYQLDRGRLENALGRSLAEHGIRFCSGARVTAIEMGEGDAPHQVTVAGADGHNTTLTATWVVDGTGRNGMLKRRFGLSKRFEHEANAAWFRIAAPLDIDDWSDDPAWRGRIVEGRRELSTNHLLGEGYWVWLIRLASDAISIGIVADPRVHPFTTFNSFARALDWLRAHEPQCADMVAAHADELADFRVMKDYSYGCEKVFSAERWCLAGESGLFLDPLYSPGLDLIAVSNGLITDLICHALDGDDVADRAAIHNTVFLLLAEGWLGIYDKQYPLMGNARVMLVKVIWDTGVYWAVPGLLFFHDQLRRLVDRPAIVVGLGKFGTTNAVVQRFLREWAVLDDSTDLDPFIRFYDFDFMPRLHLGMTADLPEERFAEQFAANVRFIEQLSGQLIAEVSAEFAASDQPAKREQAARWLADETMRTLIAIYEQENPANPVDPAWITHDRHRQLAVAEESR
ncbi:NAD(P)/FAD-dependent oxidoreductase [Nocardia rhizosphaerae]|uniref:NAD(P)/FAD-dependent oxidoreductase n=1 Tax=Nocardia rhizosphaerae TaxID=1691571 RepID=A0ABV8LCE1_9NOCA